MSTFHVYVTIEGVTARETVVINDGNAGIPDREDAKAWAKVEWDLIHVHRFRTHECGCCLSDERIEAVHIVEASHG